MISVGGDHNLGTVIFISFCDLSARGSMGLIPSDVTIAPTVQLCCNDDLVVFLFMYLSNGLNIIQCFRPPMHI